MAATLHDMVRKGIPPQAFGFRGGAHAAQGGGQRQSTQAPATPANKK